MRANVSACDWWVPCEKLRRKTLTPAAINASRMAGSWLAGPTVAMIFVCRIGANVIRLYAVRDPLHFLVLAGPHPRSLRLDWVRSLAAAAGAADSTPGFFSASAQHGL